MTDLTTMLNTIRANASADYQATVPLATRTNLTTIGTCIMSVPTNTNEFLDILVNRIAMTVVESRTFKNPLSVLKKGNLPLGQGIQEIYNNATVSTSYDNSSTDMLKIYKPDTKVAYYRVNREAKFCLTITPDMLQRAFISMFNLNIFVADCINQLYNGDEIEQFEITKNMMASAYSAGQITSIQIYDENDSTGLKDADVAKELVKGIQTYSELIALPTTAYNKYTPGSGGTKVKTWTPKNDQVLILPANVKTNMNVEVLAYAFNVSLQQFNQMTLTIDSFGNQPILGLLCDKSCFQIYDNLLRLKNFENGDTLNWHYWLHHHQTFGFSVLSNAIAFTYLPKTA